MPTVRLTAKGVGALATEQVQEDFYDDLVTGLILRVGRGGTKTYLVRYRTNGKYRRLTLGRHPHLSLADAREKAKAKLVEAQDGQDPAQKRKLQRSKDTTFAALAEEALETKKAKTREKTQRDRRRIVDAELLPAWGSRPAGSITRRDVVELVDRIGQRAPVMANRTLAAISVIFNLGLRRGFPGIEANPAHLVDPLPENGRDRFLDNDEIKVVWNATAWESPVMRAIFRLTLLTAQRVGSVRALCWADIVQADVWRIPAPVFKGKRDHLVPLSPEARAVLEEVRPLTGALEYAFPGRADGGGPHVANTTKALERIRGRTEIPTWTVHDFRTTFRTHATRARDPEDPRDPAGLGIAPNVADAVLGHKEASLGFGRYTGQPERYLLSEKREALKRWGEFVRKAVDDA